MNHSRKGVKTNDKQCKSDQKEVGQSVPSIQGDLQKEPISQSAIDACIVYTNTKLALSGAHTIIFIYTFAVLLVH